MVTCYIIAGVISLLLIAFYCFIIKRRRRPDLKILLLLPVMVFGFALYLVGFLPSLIGQTSTSTDFGTLIVGVLRTLDSTVDMLAAKDNYNAIQNNGDIFKSSLYLVPFWIVHFLAFLVTVMAAITVLGRNLADKLRLLLNFRSETYIIYGVNSKSLCLGQSVVQHEKSEGRILPSRLVIYIDDGADEPSKEKIHRMGAILLSDPIFYGDSLNKTPLQKAGLTRRRKNKYVFAFTESEVVNFSIANGIWDVAREKGITRENLKGIYIHADLPVISEELEQKAMNAEDTYRYDFNFFCEEELAARKFIEENPPCRRISFDPSTGLPRNKAGQKKPTITAVILGFGEMGKHVLRQMLMNGQFVGCAFNAVVFDKRANEIKGAFKEKYPSLFDPAACPDITIEFHHCDAGSEQLYQTLHDLAEKNCGIDYVVTCMGDDNLNFEVLADVRHYLLRHAEIRNNMPILAAHIADKNYRIFNDDAVGRIKVFGQYDDIFTHRILVGEEMDTLAKMVNSVAYGGEDWSALSLHEKNSNRAVACFLSAYFHILGFELVTGEQKLRIEQEQLKSVSEVDFAMTSLFERIRTAIDAPGSDPLLENLGITEHLRWNAFHFANGWTQKPLSDVEDASVRKDLIEKKHACLVSWEALKDIGMKLSGDQETYRRYDKEIVATAYNIIRAYNDLKWIPENRKLYIIPGEPS